jgi:hypothetical protein
MCQFVALNPLLNAGHFPVVICTGRLTFREINFDVV